MTMTKTMTSMGPMLLVSIQAPTVLRPWRFWSASRLLRGLFAEAANPTNALLGLRSLDLLQVEPYLDGAGLWLRSIPKD